MKHVGLFSHNFLYHLLLEFPGDLRNGTFKGLWDKKSDKTKLNKRSVELNNGRAAMMGILGLMVHEQLGTNMPIIGQL